MSTKPAELAKAYDPAAVEGRIYEFWESNDSFRADAASDKPPFTIMIPPPNVTGVLHMGHALNNTLQDIVIRHRRMAGYEALWVPGTDHAGIATQAVVEKQLFQEKNIRRQDLGREGFVAEVWKWREHHGDFILKQLRRLGCSCDWSRTKFTLDEDMVHAVMTAFVRLWEKGLVYRGARLVNWDCTLMTAVSDDEIEYVPRKGNLWYIRYPLPDGSGHLTVATTRPETMLGDTGVAVHPDDERYRHLVGKKIVLPLMGREIPLVADETVDPEFGTGAVKVTPGHDPADYVRGTKHSLPVVNILNPDGTLNEEAGSYAGLPRGEARKKVVADLEALGLLEKIEEIDHNVAVSDRSKDAIEPLISEQWFVKMEPLAKPAIAAVKSGRLVFAPERWAKVYLDWLENVRDWCISRQLWWGHRIPVWYDEDHVPAASVTPLEIGSPHPKTGKPIVRQDEDVLDTWASSWLWPFATLGWPEHTPDLAKFYPTQFLSTAREIIYLWVARMVMAGYELLDHLPEDQRCPFDVCYINATVLDGIGRRMSKSLGNGIDPIEMIDRYGADAVRYSLVMLTREGQDVKLSENRFELGQRFCNKIWNATRFALANLDGVPAASPGDALEDRWILSRAGETVRVVSHALENYHFHDGAAELYRFFWNDLCDWYLEVAKRRLSGDGTAADRETARATLLRVLSVTLRLLHPYLPFLTEELWGYLPGTEGTLIRAEWPTDTDLPRDEAAEADFDRMRDVITAIRNVRASMSVPPSTAIQVLVDPEDPELGRVLAETRDLASPMARIESMTVQAGLTRPSGSAAAVVRGGTVYIPLAGIIDLDVERERLAKEHERLVNLIGGAEKKLANENFVSRAKPEVVEREREKLESLRSDLAKVEAARKEMG